MEIGSAIVEGVAVLVIDILAISFVNKTVPLHAAAGFVSGGTAADLLLGAVVIPVFFFVVALNHCSIAPVSSTTQGTLHP